MVRWKVLVVDDQKDITANLQKQLMFEGYEVRIANSKTEALFILKSFVCDIAILDIQLPDGTGIDVFKELRKKNKEVYSILITGNATIENAITALNEGVNAYLVKPFSNEELKAAIIQAQNNLKLKNENRALMQRIVNNREFYEDLLNSTSEAILVVDLDFKIQYSNNAAQKILDTTEKSLLKNEPLHQYIDDGYKVLSHIYQQLVLGKPVAGYRVGIKSGSKKSLDAHLFADFLYSKNEQIEGLIVNLSNTMIHDELFGRILRKEKLATIVNLANALAHELRNPINILFGRLQLLEEELSDDSFHHAYTIIERQIDRLLKITELLGKFNFSREDSIPEKFSISEILQEAIAGREEAFKKKKIRISRHFEQKELQVEGNHNQFLDAFNYLLDALIEMLPEGKKLEIKGKTNSAIAPASMVEIQFLLENYRVKPEEIFDPYSSGDMKSNSLIGLGMTIMNTVFTNYGAKIDIFNRNQNDSLIRIRFPSNENLMVNGLGSEGRTKSYKAKKQ